MQINGRSIIGSGRSAFAGSEFHGKNPSTGEDLTPAFIAASHEDCDRAARLAEEAFPVYARQTGKQKAVFLRAIASNLESIRSVVTERAHLETTLPLVRLEGEVTRTSNQLRLFADLTEDGSWCDARIDPALPDRQPLPRPDIRSMLRPLGPVAVFGASNFPFAFSVAGGDTASALAAGNPVIVKAHPAHPGTSELTAQAIRAAVDECDLPDGTFSILFDSGIEIGAALVQHPAIKAVGFTGSLPGGRALMDLTSKRPDPIPCYAEMSSTNPVFILPGALEERASQIADGLYRSFTLGAGQFCTKPGLIFMPDTPGASALLREMARMTDETGPFNMLTAGIATNFKKMVEDRQLAGAELLSTRKGAVGNGFLAEAVLFESKLDDFLADPVLSREIFGPETVVVRYTSRAEMLHVASALSGHLTATLLGNSKDFEENQELIEILERKVGRLVVNGYPTGVEVCNAIIHGGPYPATSDGRSTSVGTRAILRFCRPVCYQGFPQTSLPPELQDSNPLGIYRMLNGNLTRDRVS